MQTLKLKYKCIDELYYDILHNYMSLYSKCLYYLYNRFDDSNGEISEKDLRLMSKDINNIEDLDSWFILSAVKESMALHKSFLARIKDHEDNRDLKLKDLEWKHSIGKLSDHLYSLKRKAALRPLKLIFGGKDNWNDRLKTLISKEQFKEKRLSPLSSIGEALQGGNRKFKLNTDLSITFKPSARNRYSLKACFCKNQEHILKKLYDLTILKSISLSYKLSKDYIYISFDERKINNILKTLKTLKILNRVLALDLNPNYIGWSIVDWENSSNFRVATSGVYSFKMLSDIYKELNALGNVNSNDKRRIYLANKRTYETIKVAENIINKAIYYKCQILSIEDLNIPSKDRDKGKNYNALCNNHWLRSLLTWQLEKRCNIHDITLLKVKPQYSSFIGNFIFRSLNLPDMILSSIEIGRRGYEFYNQYITKTKEQQKNIIQPNINDFKDFWRMSMEELIPEFNGGNLVELYNFIKSKKDHPFFKGDPNKVRILINNNLVRRFFSNKSMIYTES